MELIFATNNAHKLDEIRAIIGGRAAVRSLAEAGIHEDIPETAPTLRGNALQKARFIRERFPGTPVFADDTGLLVDALDGAPGVRSARYAPGEGHDSKANMAYLLSNLASVPAPRTARFCTVIAYIDPAGEEHIFEGTVEGEILTAPEGDGGFGYDPVFRPEGFDKTFATMTPGEKNAISHRGRATEKFISFLDTTL